MSDLNIEASEIQQAHKIRRFVLKHDYSHCKKAVVNISTGLEMFEVGKTPGDRPLHETSLPETTLDRGIVNIDGVVLLLTDNSECYGTYFLGVEYPSIEDYLVHVRSCGEYVIHWLDEEVGKK